MLANLLQPGSHGFGGQMVEAERGTRRIVQKRVETVVEQRQPVLHAGIAASGAHRFVQRILGRDRTKGCHITLTEQALGRGAERELVHRHQSQLLHDPRRALGFRIEALDALERVVEEIETHRACASR